MDARGLRPDGHGRTPGDRGSGFAARSRRLSGIDYHAARARTHLVQLEVLGVAVVVHHPPEREVIRRRPRRQVHRLWVATHTHADDDDDDAGTARVVVS